MQDNATLELPSLEKFYQLCKGTLKINDKSGKGIIPFQLRREQALVASKLLGPQGSNKVVITKGRQVGSSTLQAALMATAVVLNPGRTFGICSYNELSAKNLLSMVHRFLHQLGAPIAFKNHRKITVGDAEGDPTYWSKIIIATGASGGLSQEDLNQSFAGEDLAYAWVSEAAFFENPNTLSSITAAASKGYIVVESTPNGATRKGEPFYRLMTAQGPGWERLFIGVEDSELYTADPTLIDDSTWEQSRVTYGFTSRPHAAWWLTKRDSEGLTDLQMARQYPVTLDMCWSVTRESYFDQLPELGTLHQAIPLKVGFAKIWNQHEDHLPLIAGVDCALGRKKDSSAITVLEMGTGRLIATYKSNEVEVDDLVEVMVELENHLAITEYIIESNNMGGWVAEKAELAGLPISTKNTNKTPIGAMTRIKKLIKSGHIAGGEELVEECKSLVLTERGQFAGSKDLLMSLTMIVEQALDWDVEFSASAPNDPNVFRLNDFVV